MDGGTLYQLRNLLKRRSVKTKIKKDPTDAEEFFILVVEAYLITGAMKKFGMVNSEDTPTKIGKFDVKAFEECEPARRMEIFCGVIAEMLDEYLSLEWPASEEASASEEAKESIDHKFEYTKEVITLGLFYIEFANSIKEGDGNRIIRCWRYFLLVFKSARRDKYPVEAFNLLVQFHFIFTERMKMQLLWSRTINVHGKKGKNVAMDMHMEHLNRECKGAIGHLQASINEKSVERVGKSLKKFTDITQNFDKCTGVAVHSGYHSKKKKATDLNKVIAQL